MLTEVRMPKLGMAMKKGAVTKWLKAEGETVQEGAELFELATEKITAVVPAPASGLLGRVVAQLGAELPVGALLALIGEPGEVFPPAHELAASAAEPQPGAPPSPAGAPPAPPGSAAQRGGGGGRGGDGAPVSPAARRRARELGVDVALVPPSAPGKRIMVEDVEAFAATAEAAAEAAAGEVLAPAGRVVPFTGIRKVAVARLLADHPLLNATLTDQGIVVPDAVHVGIAVALEDGLIVPVIRDAGTRPLAELARDRADLAAKAQAGTLTLDEVEGGTFTISNLGSFGADAFTPIVNPPQCAILGVGRIVDKPVAVEGRVEVRPLLWLSLTFDHRIVDGAPAARFLRELGDRLATPAPG